MRSCAAKSPDSLDILESVLAGIRIAEAHPGDTVPSLPTALAEKDRPVLAAAVRLGCEVLVTGDRTHFGELYGKTIGGVEIHSPRSLAEALL